MPWRQPGPRRIGAAERLYRLPSGALCMRAKRLVSVWAVVLTASAAGAQGTEFEPLAQVEDGAQRCGVSARAAGWTLDMAARRRGAIWSGEVSAQAGRADRTLPVLARLEIEGLAAPVLLIPHASRLVLPGFAHDVGLDWPQVVRRVLSSGARLVLAYAEAEELVRFDGPAPRPLLRDYLDCWRRLVPDVLVED